MPKQRIDSLLVERGLFTSRARAEAAVIAGEVRLGHGGSRAQKPGQLVSREVAVTVDRGPEYVSRGGKKLENALRSLDVDASGRLCLDVGAATGGFTDCLLHRGAAHVTCVDVAYGELDWRLRNDSRVTVLERTNARDLASRDLDYRPDLLVVDLSFISLVKVLGAVLACAADRFDCLALVKPQFELRRDEVGKGGVVRSKEKRRSALVVVGRFVSQRGYVLRGYAPSELPGPAGNRETFIWFQNAGSSATGCDPEACAWGIDP